ncbi:hypothetical protein AX15_002925 [Amanita polypyramis BW_CC]|nr:hypothetical protein AX15_002925 [Amanita polypyramis BW_CC]
MKIVPVPVRQDNYSYLLIDDATSHAAAIDPYDVPKIQAAAAQLDVLIVANITTHHHFDHSGGNKEFALRYPSAPIYGGSDKVQGLTKLVKDKDEFTIGKNIHVKCLATPCHTQDSICYYFTDRADSSFPGGIFTGDTLFIGGSGRFFEGTGEEMHHALSYLATLPDETIVYNGHEYTTGNVAFAKAVDPQNPAIARLEALTKENKVTTGLTTIGDEKQWNVFMRLGSEAVRRVSSISTRLPLDWRVCRGTTGATTGAPEGQVMELLRELKNNFRG